MSKGKSKLVKGKNFKAEKTFAFSLLPFAFIKK